MTILISEIKMSREELEAVYFRMRVVSDGDVAGTRVCDPETGEEFDNIALRGVMPAIDEEGKQYWKALVEVDWPELEMDLQAMFAPERKG